MHPSILEHAMTTLLYREKCLKELETDMDKATKALNKKLALGQFIDDVDVKKFEALAERARELRIACEEDRKYLEYAQEQ